MSFYFSLYQIIDAVERLGKDIQNLSSKTLRISPRDARANRELLDQCQMKLSEVEKVLNNKTHISKISLRKAALLYQVVLICFRRIERLSAAAGLAKPSDASNLWVLQAAAQKHYQTLVKVLKEQTGIAPSVPLEAESVADLPSALKREFEDQGEILKHLDRAVEVFGEEEGLLDSLMGIRKELQDLRKRQRQFSSAIAGSLSVTVTAPLPPSGPPHPVPRAVNA